jgi:ketosteroid isomerase-like protein
MGEPADVIRRGFEVVNVQDEDSMVALCDPAIEFNDVPEIPDSGVYRGHEGIRAWLRKVREISDDLTFQILELEEKGDAVLVETGAQMHGRSSGAGVDWRFWTVWRVRDGLIYYHHGYTRREDAVTDFEAG